MLALVSRNVRMEDGFCYFFSGSDPQVLALQAKQRFLQIVGFAVCSIG